MDTVDIDHNFEPEMFRPRSNTWPLRPSGETEGQNGSPPSEDQNVAVADSQMKQGDPHGLTTKKTGSRRNAWGNMSYADLITKAITSTSEKRLTLSQIYDWMVQNVAYFKDKGDSTSSAGWKNSIRHNLSLHSRFMRIQNEGTGKSSWWVINPDAKPGKAPRRRASTMETKPGMSKGGRLKNLKKRVQDLREKMENGDNPAGGVDYLDSLGYEGFRSRADSSASSCGRLTPIQAVLETDLNDNQVPPMSTIPWGKESDEPNGMYPGEKSFPNLMESLVQGMKLDGMDITTSPDSDPYLSSSVSHEFTNSPLNALGTDNLSESDQFSSQPAPPPYPEQNCSATTSQQLSPLTTVEQTAFPNSTFSGLQRSLKSSFSHPADLYSESIEHLNSPTQLSINTQPQTFVSPDRSQQNSPNQQAFASHLSPPAGQTSTRKEVSSMNQQQLRALLGAPVQRTNPLLQQANTSILRKALTRGSLPFNQTTNMQLITSTTTASPNNINSNMLSSASINQIQQQQQFLRLASKAGNNFHNDTRHMGCRVLNNAMTCTNNQINGNNYTPLDIDPASLIRLDLETLDMEQMIEREIILEGNLDFNYDYFLPTSASS